MGPIKRLGILGFRKKLVIRDGKAVLIDRPKKSKHLDHLAISFNTPPMVAYIPLYDEFPDSKYEIDERWNYDQSGMTPQELLAKDRKIHREIIDENTHKTYYKGNVFDYGECCNCGKRFYEYLQKICEDCGVNLSRM